MLEIPEDRSERQRLFKTIDAALKAGDAGAFASRAGKTVISLRSRRSPQRLAQRQLEPQWRFMPMSAPCDPVDYPMSIGDAEAMLARIRQERPDLDTPRREGFLRGIDVYSAEALSQVFCRACNNFHQAHGRYPDLVRMPATVDHFFAMKFFSHIPRSPNPADKLDCVRYIPRAIRDQVGIPQRVWISKMEHLPDDDKVPPGVYWLKCSNGSSMQRKVMWPPSADLRAELTRTARGWLARRYGVALGEWWYGLTKPRLFLEKDLSPLLWKRPEYKFFVRNGVVRLFYAISHKQNGRHCQAFFDAGLHPIEGHSAGYHPLDATPPENIDVLMKAAAEIGKAFELARIDFLNPAGSRPAFGEITLCNHNARLIFTPPAFDRQVSRLLFE